MKISKKDISIARKIADGIVIYGGPDWRSLNDEELITKIRLLIVNISSTLQKISVSAEKAANTFTMIGKIAGKIENKSTITE